MARDEINAFLGSGTVYTGDLSFEGAVRIDGTFSGNITSEGTLIVGQGAKVTGTIKVGSLVISGNLEGDALVSGKAIFHKTAVLIGKLSTKLLIMEEGALLNGDLRMSDLDRTGHEISVGGDSDTWTTPGDSLQ